MLYILSLYGLPQKHKNLFERDWARYLGCLLLHHVERISVRGMYSDKLVYMCGKRAGHFSRIEIADIEVTWHRRNYGKTCQTLRDMHISQSDAISHRHHLLLISKMTLRILTALYYATGSPGGRLRGKVFASRILLVPDGQRDPQPLDGLAACDFLCF